MGPLQGVRQHQAGLTNTHSHRNHVRPPRPSVLDVNQRKCPEDPDWLVGSTASSVLAWAPSASPGLPQEHDIDQSCQSDAQCCHSETQLPRARSRLIGVHSGDVQEHITIALPCLSCRQLRKGRAGGAPSGEHPRRLEVCSQLKNIRAMAWLMKHRSSFT